MRSALHSTQIAILGILMGQGCGTGVVVNDISGPPPMSQADEKHAGVFALLDGTWKGRFFVYEDPSGQKDAPVQPSDERGFDFDPSSLSLVHAVDVTQVYVSESPYFQRVTITDEYIDGNGVKRIERSQGVNKVQEGRLRCVVIKPDETVVHTGETEGINIIIWRRSLTRPLKMEHFRETVADDRYTIRGWGYYGDDDPDLAPRIWFLGKYARESRPLNKK